TTNKTKTKSKPTAAATLSYSARPQIINASVRSAICEGFRSHLRRFGLSLHLNDCRRSHAGGAWAVHPGFSPTTYSQQSNLWQYVIRPNNGLGHIHLTLAPNTGIERTGSSNIYLRLSFFCSTLQSSPF